jgi:TATA-box binding protein (TBP) (component of TFIID and TFIIIB)
MTTGNMLIKGAKDQAECEKIYNKVNKVISK